MSIIYSTLERLEKEGPVQAEYLDVNGSNQGLDRGSNTAVTPLQFGGSRSFPVKTLLVAAILVLAGTVLMVVWPGSIPFNTSRELPPVMADRPGVEAVKAEHQLPLVTPAEKVSVEPKADHQTTETVEQVNPSIVASVSGLPETDSEIREGHFVEDKSPSPADAAGISNRTSTEETPGQDPSDVPSADVLNIPSGANAPAEKNGIEQVASGERKQVTESASSSDVTRPEKIEDILETARLALSDGQYQQVFSVMETLSPVPEHRADFWLVKGSAHLGLGQLDLAEKAFESAQALLPDHALIAVQRSIVSQEKGDHAGALQILRNAARQHPNVPEIFLNQGYSQQALGEIRDAGYSFRTFLKLTEGRSLYAEQRKAVNQWLAQTSSVRK